MARFKCTLLFARVHNLSLDQRTRAQDSGSEQVAKNVRLSWLLLFMLDIGGIMDEEMLLEVSCLVWSIVNIKLSCLVFHSVCPEGRILGDDCRTRDRRRGCWCLLHHPFQYITRPS